MEPGQDYGVKWLVEERDRLLARVAVLENELVRRDELETRKPPESETFSIGVDALALATMLPGNNTAKVADLMVHELAREIINRSLHRIIKMRDGSLRLWCLVRTERPRE